MADMRFVRFHKFDTPYPAPKPQMGLLCLPTFTYNISYFIYEFKDTYCVIIDRVLGRISF